VSGLLVLCGVTPVSSANAEDMPFAPGEKLTFVLKWEMIPAGHAVMEVLPESEIAGEKAFHFAMSVRTNSFADLFFKVRDKIDSYVDMSVSKSLFFKQKQREGRYHRDIEIVFDWRRFQSRYTSSGKPREPMVLYPGTFDPLSILYYFRSREVREGDTVSTMVTDGKKNVIGEAHIVRRELVKVPAGEFDTWLVEPDLKHLGGVFKKSRDALLQIWITTDERRIPVKVKSKVVVGSFFAELVEARFPEETGYPAEEK
jgi:hypothetical protein